MDELDDDSPTIPDGLIQDFTPFDRGWDFLIRRAMERNRQELEQSQAG